MTRNSLARAGAALAAGTVLALSAALPASAHVSVGASSTAAGSTSLLSFNLPHACDGSPTTRIEISLPEEIVAATPTVLAGWEVEKVMAELSAPGTDSHGAETTERVARVVYRSTTGGLPEGYRAQFDVQLTLPALEAGTELVFPVLQSCAEGEESWEPSIVLTAAEEGAGHDGHGGDHGTGEDGGSTAPAAEDGADLLARGLGIGGLVVGAAGLAAALATRRRSMAGR